MTQDDFRSPPEEGRMVVLTDNGVKKFVHHYEQKIQGRVYHRKAQGQVSYRRCFELQGRELAQVILDQETNYKPFLVR